MATVVLLLTDIEGSTRRWVENTEAMRACLERHDEIVNAAITAQGGTVFKHTGDGMLAMMPSAAAAARGQAMSNPDLEAFVDATLALHLDTL